MSSSNSPGSPDLLEVGRIEKVHGLRGEVVVGLVTNMVEARTAAGAEFRADGQPLTVVSARRHKNKWLVSFDGITSREAAEGLRGRTLLAEPLPSSAAGEGQTEGFATEVVAFVHELIGLHLVDQHGTDHGEVVSVLDNPAADLLELTDGRLVPLSFYRAHDSATVTVEVPLGLLDDGAIDERVDDPEDG
ncbi:MAG: ribosome maturation factor RimM [Actinomycetota bacterium]